jgi:hypothetical protein
VPLPLFLYLRGRGYKKDNRVGLQYDPNQNSISTCLFYIYSYRYNYLRHEQHVMVLWNLLDGGPSRSGPLLGPFEFLQGGTPGINPRQQPSSAWQVSR